MNMGHQPDDPITRRAALHCAILQANQEGAPKGQQLIPVDQPSTSTSNQSESTEGNDNMETGNDQGNSSGVKRVS